MRPASITSNGGAITVPPAAATLAVVASTSSTLTYEFQCGGTPAAAWSPSGAIARDVRARSASPSSRRRRSPRRPAGRRTSSRTARRRTVLAAVLVGRLQVDPVRRSRRVALAFGHRVLLVSRPRRSQSSAARTRQTEGPPTSSERYAGGRRRARGRSSARTGSAVARRARPPKPPRPPKPKRPPPIAGPSDPSEAVVHEVR